MQRFHSTVRASRVVPYVWAGPGNFHIERRGCTALGPFLWPSQGCGWSAGLARRTARPISGQHIVAFRTDYGRGSLLQRSVRTSGLHSDEKAGRSFRLS